jgi:hypothetical protein
MEVLIHLLVSVVLAVIGSTLDNISTRRALKRGGVEANVWLVQKLMDRFGSEWGTVKNLLVYIVAGVGGIFLGPGMGYTMFGAFVGFAIWNETRMR